MRSMFFASAVINTAWGTAKMWTFPPKVAPGAAMELVEAVAGPPLAKWRVNAIRRVAPVFGHLPGIDAVVFAKSCFPMVSLSARKQDFTLIDPCRRNGFGNVEELND